MTPDRSSPTADDKALSRRMFDRIAMRYDLLNRILSMRRDVAWRRRLCRHVPASKSLSVLDLATGTGDVLIALQRCNARVKPGVALDPSMGMLALAAQKFAVLGLRPNVHVLRADAQRLPLDDASFDLVTIAFGIRNVPDPDAALCEMRRVLRPGGRALILEFSIPQNLLFRTVYLLYFRHVLPSVGGFISGDAAAYRYLNRSVETFPYGAEFAAMMTRAGLTDVRAFPLTLGIATLYQGDAT